MIGLSEVILTEPTLSDYADTLAYLGAAIRLYRDTFRRLGLLGGQGNDKEQDGQDGDGQPPTGKAGERFKVACGCQPPRSFWIRANSTPRGRSPAGSAGSLPTPRTPATSKGGELPGSPPGSSRGVEADPGLVGQPGDSLGSQHRRELAQHCSPRMISA